MAPRDDALGNEVVAEARHFLVLQLHKRLVQRRPEVQKRLVDSAQPSTINPASDRAGTSSDPRVAYNRCSTAGAQFMMAGHSFQSPTALRLARWEDARLALSKRVAEPPDVVAVRMSQDRAARTASGDAHGRIIARATVASAVTEAMGPNGLLSPNRPATPPAADAGVPILPMSPSKWSELRMATACECSARELVEEGGERDVCDTTDGCEACLALGTGSGDSGAVRRRSAQRCAQPLTTARHELKAQSSGAHGKSHKRQAGSRLT